MVFLSIGITAQTTITIGAGATTGSSSFSYDPISRSTSTTNVHYSKSIQLLTASDLSTVANLLLYYLQQALQYVLIIQQLYLLQLKVEQQLNGMMLLLMEMY